jgi:hypothetical protein
MVSSLGAAAGVPLLPAEEYPAVLLNRAGAAALLEHFSPLYRAWREEHEEGPPFFPYVPGPHAETVLPTYVAPHAAAGASVPVTGGTDGGGAAEAAAPSSVGAGDMRVDRW